MAGVQGSPPCWGQHRTARRRGGEPSENVGRFSGLRQQPAGAAPAAPLPPSPGVRPTGGRGAAYRRRAWIPRTAPKRMGVGGVGEAVANQRKTEPGNRHFRPLRPLEGPGGGGGVVRYRATSSSAF